MKAILISLIVICSLAVVASWTTAGLWYSWWYPKTYEYALKLADDASLPRAKADYLVVYYKCVERINGEPRYIFKRPDLNLEKQRVILEGLIIRFQDIAEMKPSDLAYQQGMQQLTGQEMDHQLARISMVFRSAAVRQNFLFAMWMWYGWLIAGLGIMIFSSILFYREHNEL